MKSGHTYEMHNYAATLTAPKISGARLVSDKCHERVEKYSLRQRRKRRCDAALLAEEPFDYASDNSAMELLPEQAAPIASRTPKAFKSKAKAKTKAAPLSKYRRKTANARERTRMREINTAFETLRHCVPLTLTGEDAATTNEKLTKITTLRMAMRYICILDEALANPSFGADFLLECQRDGDHRFTTATTVTTATTMTSHSVEGTGAADRVVPAQRQLFSAKSAKCSHPFKSKATKDQGGTNGVRSKAPPSARRQGRRQKSHMSNAASPVSSGFGDSCESNATYAATLSSLSPSSACSAVEDALRPPAPLGYASSCSSSSLSLSSLSSAAVAAAALGTLLLESDGESLHLSEHCLSPSYTSLIGGVTGSCSEPAQPLHTSESLSMSASALDNPLELSLRLLDSSTDPYFDDHQPPSCISPLATLDSLNPFADLLHPDFPAHTSLDLFLT